MNTEFVMRQRSAMIQRATSTRGKNDEEVRPSPLTNGELEGYCILNLIAFH
jgi:hypothetical protein